MSAFIFIPKFLKNNREVIYNADVMVAEHTVRQHWDNSVREVASGFHTGFELDPTRLRETAYPGLSLVHIPDTLGLNMIQLYISTKMLFLLWSVEGAGLPTIPLKVALVGTESALVSEKMIQVLQEQGFELLDHKSLVPSTDLEVGDIFYPNVVSTCPVPKSLVIAKYATPQGTSIVYSFLPDEKVPPSKNMLSVGSVLVGESSAYPTPTSVLVEKDANPQYGMYWGAFLERLRALNTSGRLLTSISQLCQTCPAAVARHGINIDALDMDMFQIQSVWDCYGMEQVINRRAFEVAMDASGCVVIPNIFYLDRKQFNCSQVRSEDLRVYKQAKKSRYSIKWGFEDVWGNSEKIKGLTLDELLALLEKKFKEAHCIVMR